MFRSSGMISFMGRCTIHEDDLAGRVVAKQKNAQREEGPFGAIIMQYFKDELGLSQ